MAKIKTSTIKPPIPQENDTRQYWLLGLEDLEAFLIRFTYDSHLVRIVPSAAIHRLPRSWGSMDSILRSLDPSNHPEHIRADCKRSTDIAHFLAHKFVRSILKHSRRFYAAYPSLFAVVTDVQSTLNTDRFHGRIRLEFRGQSMVSIGQEAGSMGLGLDPMELMENRAAVQYERLSREFGDYVFARHASFQQDNFVSWCTKWATNPLMQVIPERVLRGMQELTTVGIIPLIAHWEETVRNVYDWLYSDAAPSNVERLDPFDAIRLAKEWHDRMRRVAGRNPCVEVYLQDQIRTVLPLTQRQYNDLFLNSIRGPRRSAMMQNIPRVLGRTQEDGHLASGQIPANIRFTEDEYNRLRQFFETTGAGGGGIAGGAITMLTGGGGSSKYTHIEVTNADYTVIWERGDWVVKALETFPAFKYESKAMAHCIGNSTRYWDEKRMNPSHYVPMSLRQKQVHDGREVEKVLATFDYYATSGFTQLKGYDNRPLSRESSDGFLMFLEDIARWSIVYTPPQPEGERPVLISALRESEDTSEGVLVINGNQTVFRNYMTWPSPLDDKKKDSLVVQKIFRNATVKESLKDWMQARGRVFRPGSPMTTIAINQMQRMVADNVRSYFQAPFDGMSREEVVEGVARYLQEQVPSSFDVQVEASPEDIEQGRVQVNIRVPRPVENVSFSMSARSLNDLRGDENDASYP